MWNYVGYHMYGNECVLEDGRKGWSRTVRGGSIHDERGWIFVVSFRSLVGSAWRRIDQYNNSKTTIYRNTLTHKCVWSVYLWADGYGIDYSTLARFASHRLYIYIYIGLDAWDREITHLSLYHRTYVRISFLCCWNAGVQGKTFIIIDESLIVRKQIARHILLYCVWDMLVRCLEKGQTDCYIFINKVIYF